MLPGCKMPEVGIREGEKLHEIMVTVEDSMTTYEYDKHFIVYPQMVWSSHSNNSEWLDVEQIQKLLAHVELEK